MTEMKGRILKGIGGFYTIESADSSVLLTAKAAGIFRHQKIKPAVGDHVTVIGESDSYVIAEIEKRRNFFVRPPVANVDRALLVFALAHPKPDLLLLDKLLIACEENRVEAMICLTKRDTADASAVAEIYAKTPYPVLELNATSPDELAPIAEFCAGHTVFLAGPSGVGKSTITNGLVGQPTMDTGSVSVKLGRGKHTTRHVELIPLKNGGYLADTPGFSSLSPACADSASLAGYFPEFPLGGCRFLDCRHRAEPGCAVRAAVEAGDVSPARYANYLTLLQAIEARGAKGRRGGNKTAPGKPR